MESPDSRIQKCLIGLEQSVSLRVLPPRCHQMSWKIFDDMSWCGQSYSERSRNVPGSPGKESPGGCIDHHEHISILCHNIMSGILSGLPLALPNADQCWSKSCYWSQCRSMPINSSQWSTLRRIERNWSAMIDIDRYFGSMPEFWSVLIGIGQWMRESWFCV